MASTLHIVLTELLAGLYVILWGIVVFQLVRKVSYGHALKSFHFGFLFLCFWWTLLRALFFGLTISMSPTLILLIYWIPINIQFATFALVVVFYAFLVHKRTWESAKKIVFLIYLICTGSLVVLTFVYIVKVQNAAENLQSALHLFIAFMYLLLIIAFAYYGFKIATLSLRHQKFIRSEGTKNLLAANTLNSLNNIGTSMIMATVFMWIIFFSRCIYNFLDALGFVRLEIGNLRGGVKTVNFLVFFCFVVWEMVPTALVLYYFRQIPQTNLTWRDTFGCCFKDETYDDRVNTLPSDVRQHFVLQTSHDGSVAPSQIIKIKKGTDASGVSGSSYSAPDYSFISEEDNDGYYNSPGRFAKRSLPRLPDAALLNNPLRYDTDEDHYEETEEGDVQGEAPSPSPKYFP